VTGVARLLGGASRWSEDPGRSDRETAPSVALGLPRTHMPDTMSSVMADFELPCQLPGRLWCPAWGVFRG
jgi:hypothetical protein